MWAGFSHTTLSRSTTSNSTNETRPSTSSRWMRVCQRRKTSRRFLTVSRKPSARTSTSRCDKESAEGVRRYVETFGPISSGRS
jgi:hypothetical protein